MKARVLVVEDETMVLLFASMVLEDEGFEVVTATDGQKGLEAGLRRDVDVIVTDYMMPRMDGMAMLRALREEGVVPPVVVTSAVARSHLGADDVSIGRYLRKPYDEQALVDAVRASLGEASNGGG